MDKLVPELQEVVKDHGYDPATLPSGSVGFSKKVAFFTVHGSASYNNGRFHGLSNLHRSFTFWILISKACLGPKMPRYVSLMK